MNDFNSAIKSTLAVALLRVSTDRQFENGESIEIQQKRVDLVAERQNITIVRYFAEHYSGRKNNRETINDLLQFLADNADIETVIVAQIDRFTRGGAEQYLYLRRQLARLNVDLTDTTGVIQRNINTLEHTGFSYDWSVRSPSQTAEIVLADQANSEVSNMLTRMIGQQIHLTQNGYQVRYPNYGYQNEKITTTGGKKKFIIMPHPNEALFIQTMFELRAEGICSDQEICQRVNDMGYLSRPMKVRDPKTRIVIGQNGSRKLRPEQLRRYVTKPIYCGVQCEKWTNHQPIKAEGTPLVSVQTFNRANCGKIVITRNHDGSISLERNVKFYQNHKHNPDFLFRHVVLCPICKKPLVASKSRGKLGNYYGYYHCSRKHKYFGVKQKEFETTVANFLDQLVAKPAFLPIFREVVRDVWMKKNRASLRETNAISDHVAELKVRQQNAIEKIQQCQSTIVQRKLEEEVEHMEAQIIQANKSRAKGVLKDDQIEAYFQVAKKLMEHPRKFAFNATSKQKLEKIWGFIFTTPPTYQQLTDGTPHLTLIYRLSGTSGLTKTLLAEELRAQWNTFCDDVCGSADIVSLL